MPRVESVYAGARDAVRERQLSSRGHRAIALRDDDDGRHIDLSDPTASIVATEFRARFEQLAQVVPPHFSARPGRQRSGPLTLARFPDAACESARQPRREFRNPSCQSGAAHESTEHPRGAIGLDRARARCNHHQSRDPVSVASPKQLRDGATHRVADDHSRTGVHGFQQCGDVVCAIFQCKWTKAPNSPTMTSHVGCDHPEMPTERIEGAEPIEPTGSDPAVHQNNR